MSEVTNRYTFAKVDNAVLSDPEISRSAKAVFTVLAKHSRVCNNGSRQCFLLMKTIAEESAYGLRTVQKAIKQLEELGIVFRTYRYSPNHKGQQSSLFTIVGAAAMRYEDGPQIDIEFDPFPQEDAEMLEEFTATTDAPDAPDAPTQIDVPESNTPRNGFTPPRNSCAHNYIIINIKDSLTRESNAPNETRLIRQERELTPKVIPSSESLEKYIKALKAESQAITRSQDKAKTHDKPHGDAKYIHGLEQVPEILRSTVEYLMLKTERVALSDDELAAARRLAARHTPARVMKEIDAKCASFLKRDLPLNTLTLCYIAESMKFQKPTLKPRKPEPVAVTDSELDAVIMSSAKNDSVDMDAQERARREAELLAEIAELEGVA